jgi:hypothetical protein
VAALTHWHVIASTQWNYASQTVWQNAKAVCITVTLSSAVSATGKVVERCGFKHAVLKVSEYLFATKKEMCASNNSQITA